MKTYFRLTSVVLHGAGTSAECTPLELIYGCLFEKYDQNFYKHVSINQVGDDLEEFVDKRQGNQIHINIRYPVYNDFDDKSILEKNKIRVDLIHTALLRIADEDKKLDKVRLTEIKNEILEREFKFEFVVRDFVNKKDKSLVGKLIVEPKFYHLDYYIAVEENEHLKCKVHIYCGHPEVFFGEDFFKNGKWKNENELIVSGKTKEVATTVVVDSCSMYVTNLTKYDIPPVYTMRRMDVTAEERKRAYNLWESSFPLGGKSMLGFNPN